MAESNQGMMGINKALTEQLWFRFKKKRKLDHWDSLYTLEGYPLDTLYDLRFFTSRGTLNIGQWDAKLYILFLCSLHAVIGG